MTDTKPTPPVGRRRAAMAAPDDRWSGLASFLLGNPAGPLRIDLADPNSYPRVEDDGLFSERAGIRRFAHASHATRQVPLLNLEGVGREARTGINVYSWRNLINCGGVA